MFHRRTKKDKINHIIYVTVDNLNKTPYYDLKMGLMTPREVRFSDVDSLLKRIIKRKYLPKGYAVFFTHEEKDYLLIFNRPD